jgi:hypothetical protein
VSSLSLSPQCRNAVRPCPNSRQRLSTLNVQHTPTSVAASSNGTPLRTHSCAKSGLDCASRETLSRPWTKVSRNGGQPSQPASQPSLIRRIIRRLWRLWRLWRGLSLDFAWRGRAGPKERKKERHWKERKAANAETREVARLEWRDPGAGPS